MQARYDPGAPNPWFARHKYHGIPVNRNIKPISECKLHHCVGPAATVEKAIAVPILTPEHLWGTFQVEAENILTIDGSLEGNERERNKRINAAYAKLWLADNRFQWAGLAAFASKQVGCGLLHSAETIAKNRREREVVAAVDCGAMLRGRRPRSGRRRRRRPARPICTGNWASGMRTCFWIFIRCTGFSWSGDGRSSAPICPKGRTRNIRFIGR